MAIGSVAYVGRLRGYGSFVIINHDDQYFTTYAGLEGLMVSRGEYVLAGTKLGDIDNDGVVRFELRQGNQPLDPVEWIRIESL